MKWCENKAIFGESLAKQNKSIINYTWPPTCDKARSVPQQVMWPVSKNVTERTCFQNTQTHTHTHPLPLPHMLTLSLNAHTVNIHIKTLCKNDVLLGENNTEVRHNQQNVWRQAAGTERVLDKVNGTSNSHCLTVQVAQSNRKISI